MPLDYDLLTAVAGVIHQCSADVRAGYFSMNEIPFSCVCVHSHCIGVLPCSGQWRRASKPAPSSHSIW